MSRALCLMVVFIFFNSRVSGHEGHGIPGALPPAPHGGVVQEAKHDEAGHDHGHDDKDEHGHDHAKEEKDDDHGKQKKAEKQDEHGHDHSKNEKGHDHKDEDHKKEGKKAAKHEEEQELFFEAVYKNKELFVYPLVLPSGNNPMFQALSPQKEFSSVSMKIEFPRAKKVQEVKPTIHADAIKASFDAKNVNRFIIHLTVKQANEEKRASIQLENG